MKSEQLNKKIDDSDKSRQNSQVACSFIQVRDLCYQSSGKKIIDSLSFQLQQGERVALVGLNGAGKSSLLKLLVGESLPTFGKVKIAGLIPQNLELKPCLGYQASDMAALPAFSVKEYLELACQLKTIPQTQIQKFVNETIEKWNLQEVVDKSLAELSQGNMQKVAIAQAFVHKPQFLFLDEPTQALDPLEQERFVKNITNLDCSQSCIFSSHHVSEAVASSDKVMMLHYGKLIAILNLKSEEENWYLIANNDIKSISEFEDLDVAYHGEKCSLILTTNSVELSSKNEAKLQSTSGVKKLGNAKEAIMPLFSLLANQEL